MPIHSDANTETAHTLAVPTDTPNLLTQATSTREKVAHLLEQLNIARLEANQALKDYEQIQLALEADLNQGWNEITRIKEEGAQRIEHLRGAISQTHHQHLQTLQSLRQSLSSDGATLTTHDKTVPAHEDTLEE